VNFNLFRNKKEFYRSQLPDQFVPKGAQWL